MNSVFFNLVEQLHFRSDLKTGGAFFEGMREIMVLIAFVTNLYHHTTFWQPLKIKRLS